MGAGSDVSRKKLVPAPGLVGVGDNLENVEVVDSDSEVDSDMDNDQLEWESKCLFCVCNYCSLLFYFLKHATQTWKLNISYLCMCIERLDCLCKVPSNGLGRY